MNFISGNEIINQYLTNKMIHKNFYVLILGWLRDCYSELKYINKNDFIIGSKTVPVFDNIAKIPNRANKILSVGILSGNDFVIANNSDLPNKEYSDNDFIGSSSGGYNYNGLSVKWGENTSYSVNYSIGTIRINTNSQYIRVVFISQTFISGEIFINSIYKDYIFRYFNYRWSEFNLAKIPQNMYHLTTPNDVEEQRKHLQDERVGLSRLIFPIDLDQFVNTFQSTFQGRFSITSESYSFFSFFFI